MFAEQGADAALDEVAQLAEVCGTTRYRHCATREQLAVTVFEENDALTWLRGLSAWTVATFEPLLKRGHAAGLGYPEVTVEDVMLAFPMAAEAIAEGDRTGRPDSGERVRAMRHRALFVTRRA